jgi:hypothetical protein
VPDHASRPEIFFASVEYRGLLYFGPAVTEAVQLDSVYRIEAFDTLSVAPGGADLPVSARNLFLEGASSGWTATDVFQLRNEGDRTLYSPQEGIVWAYPLPPSGTDFQLGQGDLSPDAVRFEGGRVELYSPLPPGERFLMLRYRIPESEFVLPLPGETDRVEILMREPAPPAEFPPLSPASPVEMEPGNTFRRYVGDALEDTEIRAQVAPEPWSLSGEWLAVALAALLGAAGVFGLRRRRAATRTPEPATKGETGMSRDQLLLAVARLDEEFQALSDPPEAIRLQYRDRRSRLMAELRRRS